MAVRTANEAERTSSRQRQARPRRDVKAMEERRMRAADLFRLGVIPAEIARQLGVSHQVVSEWRKAWRQGGRAALRSAGRVGRPAKLSRAQLAKVERALAKGADANGYLTDLWTLPRVAEVIQRLTGVAYHPGYVVPVAQSIAAGAGNGRLGEPWNATMKPSSAGSSGAGRN